VLNNVLANAVKFTPEGGSIALDCRMAGQWLEIEVRDSGVGIAPEFLPYVFDRFRQADSTTSRTHGGLGLGLSIAKQLVEAHAGHILATSEGKDLGSTFTVQLPLAARAEGDADDLVPAAPHAPAVEPRLVGVCVLVVDDEPDAREIMATALEASGARVEIAASAREALEILERTPVDVLLSDIAMPDEDGYALIYKVRASIARKFADIPAAAVTAFTGPEDRARALAAGFQVHLPKPLRPVDLVRTVERLAHGALSNP
jgi:hypothetical protein